jgi:hypothetical protein
MQLQESQSKIQSSSVRCDCTKHATSNQNSNESKYGPELVMNSLLRHGQTLTSLIEGLLKKKKGNEGIDSIFNPGLGLILHHLPVVIILLALHCSLSSLQSIGQSTCQGSLWCRSTASTTIGTIGDTRVS